MNEKKKYEISSKEGSFRLFQCLIRQIELFDKARLSILKENDEKWIVLNSLLYAVYESSESITILAPSGKVRDIFVMSRSIIETIINICYILGKGEEAINNAKAHLKQKAFRDLNRESLIDGRGIKVTWSGLDSFKIDNELKEAVDRYTSRKGREISSWTNESIINRLEYIYEKYGNNVGDKLHFPFYAIYRHASEISHGSFFGALVTLGLTLPDEDAFKREKITKVHLSNLSMVLFMVSFAISGLISVLASENQSLDKISKESNKLLSSFGGEFFD